MCGPLHCCVAGRTVHDRRPTTLSLCSIVNRVCRYSGPAYMDPLQNALDRGSTALEFLNSPLVLDCVHVKFTSTLPPWSSRNPFQPTINEGFYTYDDFDEYELSDVLHSPPVEKLGSSRAETGTPAGRNSPGAETTAEREGFLSVSFLLRSVDPPPVGCLGSQAFARHSSGNQPEEQS